DMIIDFLMETFARHREQPAIVWRGNAYSYGWLHDRVKHWQDRIQSEGVATGAMVTLEADFSPSAVALLLALTEHGCVLVPLTTAVGAKKEEFAQIAQSEVGFVIDARDEVTVRVGTRT